MAESTQVAHGEVQTVQPPAAADLKNPEAHTHVFAAVIGSPSVHVRHFVAEVVQVAHGATQAGQDVPDR